jgi:hypothetical protein
MGMLLFQGSQRITTFRGPRNHSMIRRSRRNAAADSYSMKN